MELKDIFGEDLAGKVQEALNAFNTKNAKKAKLIDLSEGEYVSKEKHTDKLSALQSQIDDYKSQVTKRDKDLSDLQEKLKAAGPEKLSEVTQSLTDLQTKYEADAAAWQAKLDQQAYSFKIKEKASELTFSSTAAKKQFIQDATAKEFKLDGETLLGYSDWLKQYKESDPGAFKTTDEKEGKKPSITQPTNPPQSKPHSSLAEMMAAANADPNYVPDFE